MPHGSVPALSIRVEGNVCTTTSLNEQSHVLEPLKSQVTT